MEDGYSRDREAVVIAIRMKFTRVKNIRASLCCFVAVAVAAVAVRLLLLSLSVLSVLF